MPETFHRSNKSNLIIDPPMIQPHRTAQHIELFVDIYCPDVTASDAEHIGAWGSIPQGARRFSKPKVLIFGARPVDRLACREELALGSVFINLPCVDHAGSFIGSGFFVEARRYISRLCVICFDARHLPIAVRHSITCCRDCRAMPLDRLLASWARCNDALIQQTLG